MRRTAGTQTVAAPSPRTELMEDNFDATVLWLPHANACWIEQIIVAKPLDGDHLLRRSRISRSRLTQTIRACAGGGSVSDPSAVGPGKRGVRIMVWLLRGRELTANRRGKNTHVKFQSVSVGIFPTDLAIGSRQEPRDLQCRPRTTTQFPIRLHRRRWLCSRSGACCAPW
jgi:hypothetical protein